MEYTQYETLAQARKALGDEKVLHHINQFIKDYERRKAINKRLRVQDKQDARAFRQLVKDGKIVA